jgi:hydrogenase-4 component B
MGVLVVCCVLIGLFPVWVIPIMGQATLAWVPDANDAAPLLAALAPLDKVMWMGLLLVGLLVAGGFLLRLGIRRNVLERRSTWGCAYVAPTSRMQYTSSSFAEMLVGLFSWALRPQTRQPTNLPLFPGKTRFQSEVPETVLDEAVLPAFRLTASILSPLRVFQQGSIQAYLLYIFIALIGLLLWWG